MDGVAAGRCAFLIAVVAATPVLSPAAELTPRALDAWERYVNEADARVQVQAEAGRTFLWPNEGPGLRARLREGQIIAVPVERRGAISIPDGLIHDWRGALFIPNSKLQDVLAIVHDYDRYKNYYGPTVVNSKALACTARQQRFSMMWRHKVLFVNAAIEAQYESRDFVVDDRRWYSIARMTRVQEVEHYGEPAERLLPADQGNGFLWRLHSIARYEQRDGGVYVELEAIGLTRDIPASLRWLVGPLVARLARDSVTTSLRQTRDAVMARPAWAATPGVKDGAE